MRLCFLLRRFNSLNNYLFWLFWMLRGWLHYRLVIIRHSSLESLSKFNFIKIVATRLAVRFQLLLLRTLSFHFSFIQFLYWLFRFLYCIFKFILRKELKPIFLIFRREIGIALMTTCSVFVKLQRSNIRQLFVAVLQFFGTSLHLNPKRILPLVSSAARRGALFIRSGLLTRLLLLYLLSAGIILRLLLRWLPWAMTLLLGH